MPDVMPLPDLSVAPAWTALFLGLFAFFAGLGEWRKPGHWQKLIDEISQSPALQLITGLVELFLGAIVYLANPWQSPDWLSSVLSLIGGVMCIEALAITAFADIYLAGWMRRLSPFSRLWALFAMAFGVVLVVVGVLHF